MCGIAGLLSGDLRSASDLKRAALAMGTAIAHRGPDGFGTWVDADAGVALAHRRLSVIDLTEAGAQPMTSASGRYVISLNGEIYNFNVIRRRIEDQRGQVQWRGHSDTEVLVEAIDLWGAVEALSRADGMFAAAIWDRSLRTLTLARDRFGEKPVYYGLVGGEFLFGSELRAIRAVAQLGTADIDIESLEWLFQTSYIPAPRSVFRQIRKLPPASMLTTSRDELRAGREPEVRTYWDMARAARAAMETPFEGDDEVMIDHLQRLLTDSVRTRLVADVPVGTMLSGGIDSTCIAAVAQSLSSAPIKTFTIGFEDANYDESAAAAAVAHALKTDHTTLRVGPAEVLDAVQLMASIYDEPFADSSQVPTYLVSRALRERVTVALSGDAGDELFAGYNRHVVAPALWRQLQRLPHGVRSAGIRALNLVGADSIVPMGAKLLGMRGEAAGRLAKAYRVADAASVEDLYQRLITHWPSGEIVSSAGRPLTPSLMAANSLPAGSSIMRGMMLADTAGYLPHDILTKVDRASMAVALETRAPFLSPGLFDFAWSIPAERLTQNGVGKQPLRRLAERFLPTALIDRPKHGFSMPVAAWLRGPLKEWAGDLLSSDRLKASGFYNLPLVEQAWRRHLSGIDNAAGLWSILMFEAWRAS